MFKTIGAFLAPYKLFIYVGLGALLLSGWLWDRHAQYNKGVAACELKQSEAKADYWENRSERIAVEGKAALKEEQRVGTIITDRQSTRAAKVEKSRELSKDSPSGACVYTDDELSDVLQAIREANGAGPFVVPAKRPSGVP